MKIRKSARIVVLDPAGAVLLVRHQDPTSVDPRNPELLTYWVPPGGGVDEGESYEQAAIRELEEETGVEVSGVGPQVWSRERDLIHKGELKRHMERYFIARAEPPQVLRNRTKESIEEIRWWTLKELRASTETFLPEDFVELVALVIAGDVPSVPIDIHLRWRK
jgi:ADP-ribose pyrophosphatase YjhB (NUDIX family)